MSKYRYTLSDYHAIMSADIKIEGITVLAGENGCGKSTLSRWLYYLVNASQRFDDYVLSDYINSIISLSDRWERVLREIYLNAPNDKRTEYSLRINSIRELLSSLSQLKIKKEKRIDEVKTLFIQALGQVSDLLSFYLDTTSSDPRRKRILSYLDLESVEGDDTRMIVDTFSKGNMSILEEKIGSLEQDIMQRSVNLFWQTIRDNFNETDTIPNKIQLYEDDTELINEKNVNTLFNLTRAIYIDTPMALMSEYTDNIYWDELIGYICDEKKDLDIKEKKIVRRIKDIMQGEAKMVESRSSYDSEELRFISNDKLVDIPIEKTATGFKSFSYLQRLLENGFLNNETLLLIDEPEAHLHPQWIVEFARMLVFLNKDLGLKVMLASHNPDMVAALRAMADKEGILETTHFYIANSSGIPHKYLYKDLGCDIGEIFTSFNIALSRISLYGKENIQ